MFSRRFEVVIPGPRIEDARNLSVSYAVKGDQSPLWIRIRDDRRGKARIAARMKTHTVDSYGGAYVLNGTMRGRTEQAPPGELGAGPDGVRVVGHVRWDFVSYVVWTMLALAAAIGALAVAYSNEVIGWFVLAPLGAAAIHLFLLLPMLRSDPPPIAEELRVVVQGEAEARELRQLRELTSGTFPGLISRLRTPVPLIRLVIVERMPMTISVSGVMEEGSRVAH